MTAYKVVVDGSNIATEGRSLPSLAQLDEAVRNFMDEHPGAEVLVIVDSSFPNRIDPKEVPIFESAYNAGEIITPPAGTIGRGDSFILKVADKLGATVFSNDSFQEFHGTYDWLFSKGRLVGGKPIPGLGWVFTPRTPVRGPKSRDAVREAKRTLVRIGSPEAMRPMPVPKAPPAFVRAPSEEESGAERDDRGTQKRGRGRGRGDLDGRSDGRGEGRAATPRNAPAGVPTGQLSPSASGVDGDVGPRGKKRRRRGAKPEVSSAQPINDAMAFLGFVSTHKVDSEIDGIVDAYSSHGFYVNVGEARCYVQLSGVSNPPPRSAKEVVRRGETRTFVVIGFDTARRGIELGLPNTIAVGGGNGAAGEQDHRDFDAAPSVTGRSVTQRGRRPVKSTTPAAEISVAPNASRARKVKTVVEQLPVSADVPGAPAPKRGRATSANTATSQVDSNEIPAPKVSGASKSSPAKLVKPVKPVKPVKSKASPVTVKKTPTAKVGSKADTPKTASTAPSKPVRSAKASTPATAANGAANGAAKQRDAGSKSASKPTRVTSPKVTSVSLKPAVSEKAGAAKVGSGKPVAKSAAAKIIERKPKSVAVKTAPGKPALKGAAVPVKSTGAKASAVPATAGKAIAPKATSAKATAKATAKSPSATTAVAAKAATARPAAKPATKRAATAK